MNNETTNGIPEYALEDLLKAIEYRRKFGTYPKSLEHLRFMELMDFAETFLNGQSGAVNKP